MTIDELIDLLTINKLKIGGNAVVTVESHHIINNSICTDMQEGGIILDLVVLDECALDLEDHPAFQ